MIGRMGFLATSTINCVCIYVCTFTFVTNPCLTLCNTYSECGPCTELVIAFRDIELSG